MAGGQSSYRDTPQSHTSHTFSLFTPVIVFSLDPKVQPKLILETSSSNVIVCSLLRIIQLISYRNFKAYYSIMNDSRRSRRPDSRQMWDDSDRRDRNPPRDRERERGWDNRDRERDRGRGRGYRSRSLERRDNQRDRSMSPDKHRRDRGGDRNRGGRDRRPGRDGDRRDSPRRQDDWDDRDDKRCKHTDNEHLLQATGILLLTYIGKKQQNIAMTAAAHHPLPSPPCLPAPIQKTPPANPSPTSKSNPTSAAPHPLVATAAADEMHLPRR